MDKFSPESYRNHSLSAGAVMGILGSVVAVVLCGATLIKVDSLARRVEELSKRVEEPSSIGTDDSRNATALAEKANKNILSLTRSIQSAFDAIGPEIGRMKASIDRLEKAAKAGAVTQGAGIGEAAGVAGPGEYVVGPGDTGEKIAHEMGASLDELEAAYPDLDWRHLKVGQRIRVLPNPPATEVSDP
jgi:hypothetical protein